MSTADAEVLMEEDSATKLDAIRADLPDEYRQNHCTPWIIGYSGGKDSTPVVHLVFEMLLSLPPSQRARPVHIVANDTLVESLLVVRHIVESMEEIENAASAFGLPIIPKITRPAPDQSFWVNVIGRGHPSPNRSFRWCTDRVKILPTSRYIKSRVDEAGQMILLLGVPSLVTNDIIGNVLRVLYDGLFWARNLSEGGRERPLLIVMEEAHSYLGNSSESAASIATQRIVKEGRKYGIGAMIVSQRPSEINSTILSQCGTFFAMRLNNATDRSHVTSALSDNLEGLTGMLPVLRTGEAIILGEAVRLPMRTMIQAPPRDRRPDSQDPLVCDEVLPEESMMPGGWNLHSHFDADYSYFVARWLKQNPTLPED